MGDIGVGIALGIAGSISVNAGQNLQSFSMSRLVCDMTIKRQDPSKGLNLYKSWIWLLGMALYFIGAALIFASYKFAPQSTLASLGGIQFATNIFFAKLLQNMEITKRMLLGTLLTIGGTTLVVLFSSKENLVVKEVVDLVRLWERKPWIGYLIWLMVSTVVLLLVSRFYSKKPEPKNKNIRAVVSAISISMWGALGVVFAKLGSILLFLQSEGTNVFYNFFTYVTLLSWIILTVFYLVRMKSALSTYEPIFFIPLLQANFIVFSNVSGGIYFKEFNHMEWYQWIFSICGIAVMFCGVYLLVPPYEGDGGSEPTLSFSDHKTLSRQSSLSKSFSVLLMTGAARMTQQVYDIQTRKLQQERVLQNLLNTKTLTPEQTKLAALLLISVHQADLTLEKEKQIKQIANAKFLSRENMAEIKRMMSLTPFRELEKLNVRIRKLNNETGSRLDLFRTFRTLRGEDHLRGMLELSGKVESPSISSNSRILVQPKL